MRFFDFLTLIILFLLLFTGIYFIWLNLPQETLEFETYTGNISQNLPENSNQFYPNMRYVDRSISYFLSETCSLKKQIDFEMAIKILESRTILSFYKSENPE